MKGGISIVLTLIFLSAFSQKENNIWYFGKKAGMDFATTPPTVLTNSAMNLYGIGGCGSISDNNGNILFYTNGNTIWNRNHQVMSNGTGLNADTNAPNSGLIIPKPGSNSQYYVFTQTTGGYNPQISGGLYYSVVDMSLNSGLGGVLNPKNNLIVNLIDGAFAVAKHSTCGQYWLICRLQNSNTMLAYLINSMGISSTPVTSYVGSTSKKVAIPTLKVSPNSDMLSATVITNGTGWNAIGVYEVYNFNRTNGNISLKVTLPSINGPFSTEFSPNQNFLYTTSGYRTDERLQQFNLSLPTTTAIINSRVVLDSQYVAGQFDLKLGNDGKIYVIPDEFSTYVGTINFPNIADTLCEYVKYDLDLGRSLESFFPRMLPSQPNGIVLSDSCQNDTTQFSLLNPNEYVGYIWTFGDSASGANNSSNSKNPKHLFSDSGFFEITFYGLNACFELDTIIDTVYIEPLPAFNLGSDTSICSGDTIALNAFFNGSTYLWQDSTTTDSVYFAHQDTLYWVQATNGCGSLIDSIDVSHRNFDNTDLGSDTSICPGDTLLLNATTPYAQYYLWQDNSTDSIFLALSTGSYWVEISNSCDTFSDSIDVFVVNPPNINLGPDTSRCAFDSISLNGHLPGVNYLWYNGDTTQIISTADTGILWVTVSNSRCFASDSMHLGIYDSLRVDLGNDTSLCQGNPISLSAWQSLPQVIQYQWSNASTDSSIIVNQSDLYIVNVSDYCMSISDSIQVTFITPPMVNLGFDTTICFGEDLELDAGNPGSTYLWYDSSMNQYNTVNAAGKYWVRVENICGTSADTVLVNIRHAPNIFLGNDTTLCIDKTMTLDAYTDDASYLWQDGSTGRYYTVTREGEYWVNVKNVCDQDDDSIKAYYIEKPIIDLGPDTSICLDQRLILDVTTNQASYTWSDGNKDSMRVIRESGEYIVDVVNICGTDQDAISIEVEDCNCRLFIPNSFTPNGDGINDVFEVQTACNIVDFSIKVLNRWGEVIFESNEVDFKWDGNYRNKESMQENYVYSIQLSYINGQIKVEKTLTGRVLLAR